MKLETWNLVFEIGCSELIEEYLESNNGHKTNEQTAQDSSCYEGGVRRDQDKSVGVVPEHLESVVVDVKSVDVVPEHLESDVKSGGVVPITLRVELGS